MHIYVKKNYLFFNDYKVKCAVGKRGIGIKKAEGDLITPKGEYKIKSILYRKDREKKLNSKIKKNVILKNMGWCDDPKSPRYNKLIRYPYKYTSEKLFRSDNIYDIILVLDFNMRPIQKNKGSAIFIHIAKKKFKPTKGCIAVRKVDMKKIVASINYNTKVKIS